jgi:hypothetical protein
MYREGKRQTDPVIDEVLAFDPVPLGNCGSRRAVVRRSGATGNGPLLGLLPPGAK